MIGTAKQIDAADLADTARGPKYAPLWTIVWLALLLAAGFGPTLLGMAGSWFDDRADMQHGLLVPLAVGYMVWHDKARLTSLPVKVNPWGLALVLVGFAQLLIGTLSQWTFATRFAFLISLTGVILYLRGWQTVRALAYPLLVSLFMITPPTFLYDEITLRLQFLASSLAENILEAIGYSVLREGNILELIGQRLSVVEACSGIRSLVTVVFFFLVYNYFLVSQNWMRVVLLAAAIPATVLGNAMRIVLTAYFGRTNPALAEGVYHNLAGYVIVAMAGLSGVLLHSILESRMVRRPAKGPVA